MSKILRKTQVIFASNAGTNQVAQVGSLAASSPVFSMDPAVIQGLSNYQVGWYDVAIGPNSPAIEDMNGYCFVTSYQIAYVMQEGISEWDSGTVYYIGSIASDGAGFSYVSQIDNNLNNAFTSSNWLPMNGLTKQIQPGTSYTVPSEQSLMNPMLQIPITQIWTVNGALYSFDSLVVNGSIVINGRGRVV